MLPVNMIFRFPTALNSMIHRHDSINQNPNNNKFNIISQITLNGYSIEIINRILPRHLHTDAIKQCFPQVHNTNHSYRFLTYFDK